MNACTLRNKYKRNETLSFPARIFGYLATCEQLKQNTSKVVDNSTVITNNLPFVSNITNRVSPEALIHMHWSFLKY